MAFSWAKAEKRSVKTLRRRIDNYLQNGRTKEATHLKEKLKRLQDERK